MEGLISLFLIAGSILAIGKGSDWLTDSLIPIARKLGVSGSSVGLILVSAAVSLPEILVAIYASLSGYPTISLGVVLGSIICNIGLMTGLSALAKPLKVSLTTILRDGVFSIVVPILVFAVSTGGQITRLEGLAFFLLFIPYTINVLLYEKQRTTAQKSAHVEEVLIELDLIGFDFGKLKPGWFTFGLGLLFLLGGAQVFSGQLIHLAQQFRINELLIGLTLGALGPSIPNIVAAYKATKKGMGEIAVSETLGSNIFTMLVTLGISAMLAPIIISDEWLNFDLPALILMSFLLFIFILTKHTISKREGFILLSGYIAIVVIQIVRSFL
ncbi:sodium:calcium antiporter [Candidatus Gottesmanbacteria bacterium]|nr:sodium:calcium antiporter [Candidatus Gottesmanbacteria bacterium]